MQLSTKTIETLTDLVEIKLSCIQVFDREDAREVAQLERARNELRALTSGGGDVVMFPQPQKRRRGRPRKVVAG